MSDDLESKSELPVDFTIIVNHCRSGAPWPIATLHVRSDGYVKIESSVAHVAGQLLSPMLAATKKVSSELMRHDLREALINAHLLSKKEQEEGQ